jgi:hypothetical protein
MKGGVDNSYIPTYYGQKGKVCPTTGHESPERELRRYNSTLSLTPYGRYFISPIWAVTSSRDSIARVGEPRSR